MNTIILFWNPSISSYKFEDFQRELEEISDGYNDMNWSVWEYEKAHQGDRFFMVRCGEGNTGICMSGYFTSKPYKAEDWSGRGRETFYMDLEPDVMIHPEYSPILTTKELAASIPSFDWTGGHSGRLLNEADAEKLENIWKSFIEKNDGIFTMRAFRQEVDPSDYVEDDSMHIEDDSMHTIICYMSFTDDGKVKVFNHKYDIDKSFLSIDEAKRFANDSLKKCIDKGKKVEFEFCNVESENQERFFKIADTLLALNMPSRYYKLLYEQFDEANLLTTALYCLIKFGKETITSLQNQGFPDEVMDGVKALLPADGETEKQYIDRIKENSLAFDLKMDMLEKELDIVLLEKVTIDDVDRLNKALKLFRELRKADLAMVD
jgi:hypothetical protein